MGFVPRPPRHGWTYCNRPIAVLLFYVLHYEDSYVIVKSVQFDIPT